MALTIELTPEQETQLAAAARREGVAPEELARRFVTDQLSTVTVADAKTEDEDPTLALFAQWAKEDAQKTPEESTAEDRLWEEFERSINEVRRATGMREL